MQRSNHLEYSTRVWLTSAFITPILIALFYLATEPSSDFIFIIPLMMVFGLLFSIPNWLLLTLSVWKINQFNLPKEGKKTIISFTAFFLSLSLFLLIFSGDLEALGVSIPYSVVLIFGIWKYELKPPIREVEQSPISRRVKVLEDILDDENY